MSKLNLGDRRALDWMATDLLELAGQFKPPYDVDAVASYLNLSVEEDWDDASAALFGYSGKVYTDHLGLAGPQIPPGVFIFDGDGNQHIRIRPGMSDAKRRLVLAHEIAHAYLEHNVVEELSGHHLIPRRDLVRLLEDQAQYFAHQLLTGAAAFARRVELRSGSGMPEVSDIDAVRHAFGLRRYVAMRSYVEHSRRAAAMVSLISYDGERVKVVAHANANWVGPVWTGPEWLNVVSDDPIAWRAQVLLDEGPTELRTSDIVRHVSRACQADKADYDLSPNAVHLVLHRR